ncbi:hypothetical protein F5Y18DRAFT_427594 [Xylariaceae sp. FL1019]|nr:hypothetical protein F5Y18DRAFT_427594 [Xylariaceae sp. FL1019]
MLPAPTPAAVAACPGHGLPACDGECLMNKPRLTEEEKKQNHIDSEKKRREAIRAGFDQLCEIVPGLEGHARSEGRVLKTTVEYALEQLRERKALLEAMRDQNVPLEKWAHLRLDSRALDQLEEIHEARKREDRERSEEYEALMHRNSRRRAKGKGKGREAAESPTTNGHENHAAILPNGHKKHASMLRATNGYQNGTSSNDGGKMYSNPAVDWESTPEDEETEIKHEAEENSPADLIFLRH